MTTFTTEDRLNASPPHIVDSGASVKSLGEYIQVEKRIEIYREQILLLQATVQRMRRRLAEVGINDE